MRRCVRSYCESEIEARTTPVEPAHVVAVAVAHEALTVGRGRQRDHCVGMGVVDVVGVEQRVEWRVDRRGRATDTEAACVVVHNESILVRTLVAKTLERPDPVEVERGKAVGGQAAEIASRAFHEQHPGRLPRHRVGQDRLGRRVPPGEVRDPPVGAEPMRAPEQRLHVSVRPGHVQYLRI